MTPSAGRSAAISVDIGGTFTDVVLCDAEGIAGIAKVPTDPADPARSALRAVAKVMGETGSSGANVQRVVHATTLATNTILQGTGPPVAFLVTKGYRDLLTLGRYARVEEDRFNLWFTRPRPPVPPELVFEVDERLDAAGTVVRALDETSVQDAARRISELGIVDVAVCLLHGHVNALHELKVKALLCGALGDATSISISSETWPEWREYERATTTVMSAKVGPVMHAYLSRLHTGLRELGLQCPLYVMESAGGMVTVEQAEHRAVATIESGPAAGVKAAAAAGARRGRLDLVAFDMGGTTAKAGVVEHGSPSITHQFQVGGRTSFGTARSGTGVPIQTPAIDLAEVGIGGGSIIWIDEAGSVRVGPQSMGADPGPACYGRGGTTPTLTDASVILGLLDGRGFTEGGLDFDERASREAFEAGLVEPLGMPAEQIAAIAHRVANDAMASAIHVVTVRRGLDPREFTLVASGGAAPLHAARIAEQFDIRSVLVPPAPGVGSALGLLNCDLEVRGVRGHLALTDDVPTARLREVCDLLAGTLTAGLEGTAGFELTWSADLRYAGQGHELEVPLDPSDLQPSCDHFHRLHREIYGVAHDGPLELVNVRGTARYGVDRFPLTFTRQGMSASEGALRPVWSEERGGQVGIPCYDRAACVSGRSLSGPALITESHATTLVPEGWDWTIFPDQSIEMTLARPGVRRIWPPTRPTNPSIIRSSRTGCRWRSKKQGRRSSASPARSSSSKDPTRAWPSSARTADWSRLPRAAHSCTPVG